MLSMDGFWGGILQGLHRAINLEDSYAEGTFGGGPLGRNHNERTLNGRRSWGGKMDAGAVYREDLGQGLLRRAAAACYMPVKQGPKVFDSAGVRSSVCS